MILSIHNNWGHPVRDAKSMNKLRNQIQIKLGENLLLAKLNDSQASQEFIKLLPLSLTINDLFGREKYARLPITLSETAPLMQTYEVGDIAYWSPGPGLCIFYGQGATYADSYSVDSGLYLLGKIAVDAKFLNIVQSSMVKIEISDKF